MGLPVVVVVAADTFARGLRFLNFVTKPQLDYRSTIRRLWWSITF
jgi:hypothetical protein